MFLFPDVLSGTPKAFAVHLERKKLLRIFANYERSKSEDPQLGLMMVLIFIVCPIASFLFFTALRRWNDAA